MAVKFKWNETAITPPTFGDLRTDDFFMYNDDLFIKIDSVYDKDEIDCEVDNYHNVEQSTDIDAPAYNCFCINDPYFLALDDDDVITKVDVEISVTPKGGRVE